MATQPPAERTQRYTAAQRAQYAANNRKAAAGAKYGTSYSAQGYKPEKEQGQAYLKKQELKAKYGAFANPTWDYQVVNGQLMRKPRAHQTGRIAEQGGTARWEAVPDYVQRSFANPKRRAFFEQNPELASQPGGGQDRWLYHKYTSGLAVDPETGLRVNRAGELYDPRVMAGGAIGQQGVGVENYSERGPGVRTAGGGAGGGQLRMGGRGGGGGRASFRSTPGGGGDIESALQQGLSEALASGGPFTPEVVQNLRNQAKMDAYGPLAQEKRAINEDAISRGLFRSGIPSDVSRVAEESAAARYSGATQNIGTNAVLQNHQSRLQALDRAQKWLDSKRQWILANETNALNRELGLKQIALGYARIQAEQSTLDKQLAQSNYQFNQLNPNLEFNDPNTGQRISLAPGTLRYLDYFTG